MPLPITEAAVCSSLIYKGGTGAASDRGVAVCNSLIYKGGTGAASDNGGGCV